MFASFWSTDSISCFLVERPCAAPLTSYSPCSASCPSACCRLDAAASPASVLQMLCDRVRFRPEAALELHRQLYKSKMMTLLEARKGHGGLTDADVEELKRIRRILCLPVDIAKKVGAWYVWLCGCVYRQPRM